MELVVRPSVPPPQALSLSPPAWLEVGTLEPAGSVRRNSERDLRGGYSQAAAVGAKCTLTVYASSENPLLFAIRTSPGPTMKAPIASATGSVAIARCNPLLR